MRNRSATRSAIHAGLTAFAWLALIGVPAALASDGVIEINQARMLAGGVTPGDIPGSPVTISQPGSFRLTSDLSVSGIHQAVLHVKTSEGVTIDLNGFAIRGPFSCVPGACAPAGLGYGVLEGSQTEGAQVTVRNGRITGMSGAGIVLGAEARIENVDVSSCGEGIWVGARSVVVGNRIVRTLYRGLRFSGPNALFERNVLAQNGLGGSPGLTASVEGGTETGGNVCEDGLCRANLARRGYYLTTATHLPTEAASACAPRFHFASLWEIHDPSHLSYDATRGYVWPLQGGGPPAGNDLTMVRGWIRTGTTYATSAAGDLACLFFSSSSAGELGTVVALSSTWTATPSIVSPWIAMLEPCNRRRSVWCVED